MSFEELLVPELVAQKFRQRLSGHEYFISMSASEGHLILGGRDSVLLYNLATKKMDSR